LEKYRGKPTLKWWAKKIEGRNLKKAGIISGTGYL
jgi:hypothetical protein